MASFRSSYPTPLERQFGRFYRSHQYAHLHKNNSVCLIGLAPDHPAVAEGVVSVEYSSSACSSEALGKRKRGALRLCVDTIVCTLITQLGTRHIIRAGINGDLVEINSRLSDEPNLVSIDPEGAGFICVALTRGEADLSKCFPGYTSSGTIGEMKIINPLLPLLSELGNWPGWDICESFDVPYTSVGAAMEISVSNIPDPYTLLGRFSIDTDQVTFISDLLLVSVDYTKLKDFSVAQSGIVSLQVVQSGPSMMHVSCYSTEGLFGTFTQGVARNASRTWLSKESQTWEVTAYTDPLFRFSVMRCHDLSNRTKMISNATQKHSKLLISMDVKLDYNGALIRFILK